ncbi:MAG: Gfo/Idh/MocA family oxidoreductase [Clostridia bacterium]|nr:Gfo/Idh/MocA family oxidoreductase [Clostridia bacterium]
MSGKMRTAVVGLGVIGHVHLGVLAEMEANVVALCDIDVEKAAAVGAEYGFSAPVWGDFEKMLAEAQPDVVHICTPHYLHAPMVIAALRRGVHVLCEKPLCIHPEEIDAILAAEAASTATLGVCLQNRYNPANLFIKEYLKSHKPVAAHGSVTWHRDAAYYNKAAWRGHWDTEGGGVMINQALHTLDLLLWFLGDPTSVSAETANLTLGGVIEVEDTATATFHGSSAPFTFFATNSAAVSLPVEIGFRMENGDDLTLLPLCVLCNDEVLFSAPRPCVRGKVCYGAGHDPLIRDFYRCISEGKHFPIDGHEGARVIRLILAMYESDQHEIEIK